MAQGKLVRVTRGAALDVIVDIRASLAQLWPAYRGGADRGERAGLLGARGVSHGFCTLSDHVDFLYKVTAHYSPAHDGAVRWNDPALGIRWPFPDDALTLSPKDRAAPLLAELGPVFD